MTDPEVGLFSTILDDLRQHITELKDEIAARDKTIASLNSKLAEALELKRGIPQGDLF